MERGSAAAGSGAAPVVPAAEEGEGCAGLWELPVERCERRPECGRCRILWFRRLRQKKVHYIPHGVQKPVFPHAMVPD